MKGVSGIRIWSLQLPPDEGWVGVPDPHTTAIVDITVEGRRPDTPWPDLGDANLEDLAGNASSGAAVVAGAGIVLHWSCTEGP